ncbi:MBL fold metallo-hydrolase [Methylobacterium sp. WL6]|nr:MBL fold metallo-hydrolase [Methylobacterium sp. WL6]
MSRRLSEAAGTAPEAVDVVVLTHCHTDHIGGLMRDGHPAFPNARLVVGATEYEFWAKPERLAAAPSSNEHASALVFRTHLMPLAARTRFVKDGDEVVPGIHALAAYGHTPGHLAFHVESEGRRMLIWGDCAHHEVASLAEPGWHALFDMDKAAGAATRRRIYDMATTDDLVVAGYHTSFPSLGYVGRSGTGYRWIPVTYQLER